MLTMISEAANTRTTSTTKTNDVHLYTCLSTKVSYQTINMPNTGLSKSQRT
jgi:hypothetical protein